MRQPAYYIGKPVTSLQTMLRTIAAQSDDLPSVLPDGIYGAGTMRCVQAFQQAHCLPCTGVTDLATWQAVCASFTSARVETAPAEPLMISMAANETLSPGSDSPYILLLQAMLHTLSPYFENLSDCTLCGSYDDATEASVMCLQKAAGVPETGVCDKQLWRLLTGLYAQVTSTISCSTGNLPTQTEVSFPTESLQTPHEAEI